MIQELTNPFGRVYLTIETNRANRWIHVRWMGYLTEDNIKNGANAYVQALIDAGYNCVLNDTRLIIGGWDHSLDWVLHEWSPRAANAGLKHFAMISTPETFGGSTADTFHGASKLFETKVFDDRSDAEAWLRQYSLGKQTS